MVQQFSSWRFDIGANAAVSASLNEIPRIGIVFARVRPRYGRRGNPRMHGDSDPSYKSNDDKCEKNTRSRTSVAIPGVVRGPDSRHTQPILACATQHCALSKRSVNSASFAESRALGRKSTHSWKYKFSGYVTHIRPSTLIWMVGGHRIELWTSCL